MLFRKWARLSAQDRHLLVCVAPLVVLTRLALWVMPLAWVRRFARKWPRLSKRVMPPSRVAWAVRRVSHHVPRASCLVQAIVTQTLLSQMGFDSRLQIGVALDKNEQFQAHAWVEYDGHIVIGGESSNHYSRLLSLEQH